MNVWEAKYKALLAGIEDEELIKNAEKLVSLAINMSNTSNKSFNECFSGLLVAVQFLQIDKTITPENCKNREGCKPPNGIITFKEKPHG